MSLSSLLGIASSGLANVNQQLGIVSQNVANASTPGYARETAADIAQTAGGVGYGVLTGPATEAVDGALEASLNAQTADVAAAQVRSAALAALDAAQGATGAGNDLASRVGALRDTFTELSADPSNQARQVGIVSAAQTLASTIQRQAAAYTAGRQAAQDGLVSDVASLNTAIGNIGALSDKIISLQVQGLSTADLQSQRTAQEQTAAQLGGLKFLAAANGDVTAVLNGDVVDTRAASGPFSVSAATLGSGAGAPPVLLSGNDVTAQLTTGSAGARVALRDTTLPQAQAGLDEFAKTLAVRLGFQGLNLFTTPAGALPTTGGAPVQAGYTGFSNVVTVNPAVTRNQAVRDGTQAVTAGSGEASAFTPNPAGGPAGFTTLVGRMLQYGFGAEAQPGTPQPAPAAWGWAPGGASVLPCSPGTTLQSFAANLAGSQAQQAGAAQEELAIGQGLQATLQGKLSSETGVSVDAELSNMVVLQNAYGANAKIIAAAQAMWTTLLNAVMP